MKTELPIAPVIDDQLRHEIINNTQRYTHYHIVGDVYKIVDTDEKWIYLYHSHSRQILTVSRGNQVYLPIHFYDYNQIDSYQHTFRAHCGEVFYGGVSIGQHDKNDSSTPIKLSWVLYPDGMYFSDDGYGIRDNREVQVCCLLDQELNILQPVHVYSGDINVCQYAKVEDDPSLIILEKCGSSPSETIHKNIYTYGHRFSHIILHEDAFKHRPTLITLSLPSTIQEIQGDDPLSDCCNLQTIYVPTGMKDKFCQMGLQKWADKIVEIDEDPDDRDFVELYV